MSPFTLFVLEALSTAVAAQRIEPFPWRLIGAHQTSPR